MSSWDDRAADWDTMESTRAYAAAAFQSLQAHLRQADRTLSEARICDFGCGTGLLTERLAPHCAHVDAVDSSPAMLAVLNDKIAARGWAERTPSNATVATSLTVPDGDPYDLIVCSSVCAFLPDYPATARALAHRLKPNGLLLQWDWELDPAAAEPYGLSRAAIRTALEAASLVDVSADVAFRAEAHGQIMAPLLGVGRKPTPS